MNTETDVIVLAKRGLMALVLVGSIAVLVGCSAGAKAPSGGGGSADTEFGETCDATGDCLSGLECIEIDPLMGSVCTNACTGPTECSLGATCVITASGDFCSPGGNVDVPGQIGDPCDGHKDCMGDLQCSQPLSDADPFCVKTCDINASDCPAGQPCVSIDGDLGYCDFNATNNPQGCDPSCEAGEECVDGSCVPTGGCDPACEAGEECVDGDCVPSGGCDPACGLGEECVDGDCVPSGGCAPACGLGEECVDGSCQAATCDPACGDRERCQAGTCMPIDLCDPACADTEECIAGVCTEISFCGASGQACDSSTGDGGGLTCVVADNTSSNQTCRATCASDANCEATEFCGSASGESVCLPSNCTSVLSSLTDCAGVGGNGGTCLPVRAGVLHCELAGSGVRGAVCAANSACSAGLVCAGGACAEPCELASPACTVGSCTDSADVVEAGVGVCVQTDACQTVGESCASDAEDTGTLACAASNPLDAGVQTCLQVCELAAPNCPSTSVCQVVDRGSDAVTACLPSNCLGPLNESDCAAMGANGGNCLPAGNSTFRCVAAGTGVDGDACSTSRVCGAGLACNGSFCRDLCDLGSGIGCAAPDTCESTLGDPVAGTCAPQDCDSCNLGETCFRGQCVNQSQCEVVGQPCETFTTDSGSLACVGGGNSLDGTEVTCHLLCNADFDDCPSGSFCAPFDSAASQDGACLRSNCTSPMASATECATIGGTCGIFINDAFLCIPAGTGVDGATCDSPTTCAVGLDCLAGECTPYCDRANPSCPGAEACVPTYGPDSGFGDCWDGCPGFSEADFCDAGDGCVPITATEGLCLDVGPRLVGETCDPAVASLQCGEWLACIDISTGGTRTCEPWCNLAAPDPDVACDADKLCGDVYGDPTVGLCLESCTPFVEEVANGCGTNGFKGCVPQRDGTEGHCIYSGLVNEGQACDSTSLFGECRGGLACGFDATCEQTCRTFSGATECTAGDVCELVDPDWGVCTDAVLPGGLEPFDVCTTPGMWCADSVLCLAVDATTNGCVQICRVNEGNADCAAGDLCTDGVLVSDTLGICLPPI